MVCALLLRHACLPCLEALGVDRGDQCVLTHQFRGQASDLGQGLHASGNAMTTLCARPNGVESCPSWTEQNCACPAALLLRGFADCVRCCHLRQVRLGRSALL